MKRLFLTLVLVIGVATTTSAQFGRRFGGFGPRGYPAKFARSDSFGRGFNFCRAVYTSGRREAGGQGWSTDYPDAELNFSIRLSELTKTRVSRDSRGAPDHLVVRLTEDALYQCPYLHMEDVGTASFTDAEVRGLRNYLLKGGFLWVDDFWGTAAWEHWEAQIARVLDPGAYPIREVSPDDPLFRTLYTLERVPQITSIQFWRRWGAGTTSERGPDSEVPHARAIRDAHGRIMVLMTFNTDIADAWEREGEDDEFFFRFAHDGYAVGFNVLLHAMTH